MRFNGEPPVLSKNASLFHTDLPQSFLVTAKLPNQLNGWRQAVDTLNPIAAIGRHTQVTEPFHEIPTIKRKIGMRDKEH
jgi:cell division protein FtsX